jgi:exosortase
MSKIQNNSLAKPLIFMIGSAMSLLLFGKDIGTLFHLVNNNPEYTHLAVVPLVSGFFLWFGRKQFMDEKADLVIGAVLVAFGLISMILLNTVAFDDSVTGLFFKGIGMIIVIYGLFVLCWGFKSLKKLAFPFIFLLLAIPFPSGVLNAVISFLQQGSAAMVEALYTMLGQSFIRDGVMFHLNTLSITIAPECSGIRSTMALIITGAIAVEMFLNNGWNKILMLLLIIPMSLLKNAIRIVSITLLAQYVDMSFLTDSFLHKSGGVFFYLIVLVIYFPLLFLLSRLEHRRFSSGMETIPAVIETNTFQTKE